MMVTATAREENSEFCVTVGPVIRTVGIHLVGKRSWSANLYASLIGFHPRGIKGLHCTGNELPCNGPRSMRNLLLLLPLKTWLFWKKNTDR